MQAGRVREYLRFIAALTQRFIVCGIDKRQVHSQKRIQTL